jgi:hypothetical protein
MTLNHETPEGPRLTHRLPAFRFVRCDQVGMRAECDVGVYKLQRDGVQETLKFRGIADLNRHCRYEAFKGSVRFQDSGLFGTRQPVPLLSH